MVKIIKGLTVYSENGRLEQASVVIKGEVIHAVNDPASENHNKSIEVLEFPKDYHLIPGMIDMHIHGSKGCDVMDATPHALQTIAKTLAAEGTTGFLATTMTDEKSHIDRVLQNVCEYREHQAKFLGAEILGVHLEGPFLAAKRMNAQSDQHRLDADVELFKHWQKISGDAIRLVTVAPEIPGGLELIRYLKQQHIIASVGHSDADYAQTMAGIEAGCSHATHLFNAMRGMHHREPGAVTALLLSEQVMTELILDGAHLHPAIVRLILKLKGSGGIVLVTDAMRAKCLGAGTYDLGGKSVQVANNQARLADGTLAGSVLKMNEAVKNMLDITQCHLEDVLKMTSENPARALGVFSRKGSIAPGKDADLVVLDDQLEVVLTLGKGKILFAR